METLLLILVELILQQLHARQQERDLELREQEFMVVTTQQTIQVSLNMSELSLLVSKFLLIMSLTGLLSKVLVTEHLLITSKFIKIQTMVLNFLVVQLTLNMFF